MRLTADFDMLSFNEAARRDCLVALATPTRTCGCSLICRPLRQRQPATWRDFTGTPFESGLAASGRSGRVAGTSRGRPARDGGLGFAAAAEATRGAGLGCRRPCRLRAIGRGRAARSCGWCIRPLYDALKAGASDIHLETDASGLVDQIPHRRRAGMRRHAAPGWRWPSR